MCDLAWTVNSSRELIIKNGHDAVQTTDAAVASVTARPDPGDAEQQHTRIPVTGREMRQTLQVLTAQGQAVAAEYYQQSRERMLAWRQQLEQQVREKPLQSLSVAAGLGFLFGLLRRR